MDNFFVFTEGVVCNAAHVNIYAYRLSIHKYHSNT